MAFGIEKLPENWRSETASRRWRRALALGVAALAALLGVWLLAVAAVSPDNLGHVYWLSAFPLATAWGILLRRPWSRSAARLFLMLIVAAPLTFATTFAFNHLLERRVATPYSDPVQGWAKGMGILVAAVLGGIFWVFAGPLAWFLERRFRRPSFDAVFGTNTPNPVVARVCDTTLLLIYVALGVVIHQVLPNVEWHWKGERESYQQRRRNEDDVERATNQRVVAALVGAVQSNDPARIEAARKAVIQQNPLSEALHELRNADPQVRREFVGLLERLRWYSWGRHTWFPHDDAPLCMLLALQSHVDATVRRQVMKVLTANGDRMSVDLAGYFPVTPVSNDPPRSTVQRSLDAKVLHARLEGARDEDGLVRAYAASALLSRTLDGRSVFQDHFNDQQAVALLSEMLRQNVDPYRAVLALRQMGPRARAALPLLEGVAEQPEPGLANAARDAIAEINVQKSEKANLP